MGQMPHFTRRRVLIQRRLQLRIAIVLLCAAVISSLVQTLVLFYGLSNLATLLPTEGVVVVQKVPSILRNQLLMTLLILVPLMLGVGILETFRIAGPLYRFEQYLRDIVAGKRPGPCRIRSNDELQEFCRVLNDATQPLLHPEGLAPATAAEQASSDAVEAPASLVERPVATPAGER